jgi:hypothetical protein
MKTIYKNVLAHLLPFLVYFPAHAQTEWQLRKEKDGIKVYSSKVPDSKIKAIRVVTELNATASQVAAIVMDIDAAPDWVYHLKSSVLLFRVSQDELYYYAEIALPWPVANRDFVVHLTLTKNTETNIITIDGPAVSGYRPVRKRIVRIDNSTGRWVITPIGYNHVMVEYSIHVDLGGSLPSWLVNIFAGEAPLHIFQNLKVQLKKPIHKNAAFPSLEENKND